MSSSVVPMTAIREPSGDHAGKLNRTPGRPTGVTAPPIPSIVTSRPSAAITARRGRPASRGRLASVVACGTVTCGLVMTPRPEMNARNSVDTTSAPTIATVRMRRPRPGPTGGSAADSAGGLLGGDGVVHGGTIRDIDDTGR